MGKYNNDKIRFEFVKPYLEKFPKHSTRGLATLIWNTEDGKALWTSYDAVRSYVRNNRNESKVSRNYKNPVARIKREEQELPESWGSKKQIFQIPSGYKKIAVISDLQVPFHDVEAIKMAFTHINLNKCDCLLINGDLVDFYGLSSYEKDPRKRNFKAELEDSIQVLKWIRANFKGIIYYSLDANHEDRFEKYMLRKAPELLSTDLFKIEDLLCLYDLKIIPLRGYDHIKAGKLPILHGHTVFRSFGSVNPAKTVFDRLKTSALVAHCHKKAEYTWTDLSNEPHTCWTTGCLMNIDSVSYNPHGNNYVHGFAIVNILDSDGNFSVENKLIIGDKIV